jgi:hypothetical protein
MQRHQVMLLPIQNQLDSVMGIMKREQEEGGECVCAWVCVKTMPISPCSGLIQG